MNAVLKMTMASALALATAAPVAAQTYNPYPYGSQYRPTDAYQQQQQDYDQQRSQYEAQRDVYHARTADYQAARADYERRRADWEAARADYDARYGYGAYIRVYGPAPVWDDSRWSSAAPARGYGPAPYAGSYGANTAYAAPVRCNNNSAVTAGVIGALAGGVLGNSVSRGGGRTGGTVLGALVGGGVGAAVGHAHDVQKCDQRGAYYSYNDTVPYRVSNDVYRDDRASDYTRRGCRLAPAPVNDSEYRYVRVCPDPDGRYRVTG
ncbi:MAG: hypothetical protein JWQ97_1118 [Phenylobacterium sp.]|nr:hypothetical protein [Phenylobacterium sp.]